MTDRELMRQAVVALDLLKLHGGVTLRGQGQRHVHAHAAVALWTYDGNSCEISFTTEDAKLAGLLPAKPGSGWAKDPSAMLRARCISKAVEVIHAISALRTR